METQDPFEKSFSTDLNNKAPNTENPVRKLKELKEKRRSLEESKQEIEKELEETEKTIDGIESRGPEDPVVLLRNAFVEKAGHSFLKSEENGFDCLCGIGSHHDEEQLRVLEEVFEEFEIELGAFVERWEKTDTKFKGGRFLVQNGSLEVEGCGEAADVFEVAASLLD